MNRIIKYTTTGTLALLMLMNIGTIQNNVNASKKHYRVHVTKYMKYIKKNYESNKNNRQNHKLNQRNIYKMQKGNKLNAKKRRIHKSAKHSMKRNRHNIRRHVNQLRQHHYYNRQIFKPKYRLVKGGRRGNRNLQKSGFIDGRILSKMGYSHDYYNLIFNKYAPSDKRAVIPSYMNPKARGFQAKSSSYNDINKDFWVKGVFSLTDPQRDTKNPQVYKYYPKLHGWKLAPRY